MKRSQLIRQLRSRMHTQREPESGEMYYWLLGMVRGVRMVDGPYRSDMEAKTVARDKMDEGKWRILPLKTRDPARAKQILRHQLVTQQNVGIENAMQDMHRPNNLTSVD